MNVNGFTRLTIAACLALAVFLPRPADAGFEPAIGNYLNADSVGWGLDVQRIGDFVFVLWFTYRPDGSPVWYLAAAELDGMTLTANIDKFSWDGETAVPTTVGTLTLAWSDEENATFSWTLNGVSGELPVAFLTFAEGLTDVNHTGHYVAPEEPGWGTSVLTQGDVSAMFLYFYDQNGDPVWLLGVDATPGMQQVFPLAYFTGPGLCPSCIAKGRGAQTDKAQSLVALEVRFISVQENLFEEIGVDFRGVATLGAVNALPDTVDSGTPLGSNPFGAIDLPFEDTQFGLGGPFQTINALTPSPNMLTIPELLFFKQRNKMTLDPSVFILPIQCADNRILHVEMPAPGATGFPQAEDNIGMGIDFFIEGQPPAPAQVGVSKVGDKSISVNLQAVFANGTIEGLNMVGRITNPGGTLGMLDINEVTRSQSVPFLSQIPLLGFLFSRKVDRASNSDLQVLICARITEVSEGR